MVYMLPTNRTNIFVIDVKLYEYRVPKLKINFKVLQKKNPKQFTVKKG